MSLCVSVNRALMCVTLCSCGQDSDVCHFVLLDGQPLHEPVVQHGKLHYYCHLKTCLLIKEAATNGTCILGLVRVTLIASQWSKSSFSPSLISYGNNSRFLSIILIIYPLTTRVIWAPQMISQPVFSIFSCSPLPSAELQACPSPDVVFPPRPLSALSSSPFYCTLQDGFGQTC